MASAITLLTTHTHTHTHMYRHAHTHMEAVRPSWRFAASCQSVPVDWPWPIKCFHEANDLYMGTGRERERGGLERTGDKGREKP